jgi:transposase InsO family protein
VLDEYSRESPALQVSRSIKATDVIAVLQYVFMVRGTPQFVRSDNGPEFIADTVKKWLKHKRVRPLYIEPGCPWKNGYASAPAIHDTGRVKLSNCRWYTNRGADQHCQICFCFLTSTFVSFS